MIGDYGSRLNMKAEQSILDLRYPFRVQKIEVALDGEKAAANKSLRIHLRRGGSAPVQCFPPLRGA